MSDRLQAVKSFLNSARYNFTGKRIAPKLVILESDDWGAIRTPSLEALQAFEKKGFDIANSIYKNDALASEEDLSLLFEVLGNVKGADGFSAKLTANAIMANPDFDKIRKSQFEEYHYEPFNETFQRYPSHKNNLEIWRQGMQQKVFSPQYHGREHLNVKRWMNALRNNDKAVRFSFDWQATFSGKEDYSFMEAFDWDEPHDTTEHIAIIKDGLLIFERTFGYKAPTFIAPCYNWDSNVDSVLGEAGIRWIQGLPSQYAPTGKFGQYRRIKHNFGDFTPFGSRYNIRNCFFEPAMNPNRDWVSSCLAQIAAAFLLKRPAVICTHRINYVGFINPANRDRGLRQLIKLLRSIVAKWPDAIFISTDELSHYVND